jgi:hypothetical protein
MPTLKLELELHVIAHGTKKLELNQDAEPYHLSQPGIFIRGHLHGQSEHD